MNDIEAMQALAEQSARRAWWWAVVAVLCAALSVGASVYSIVQRCGA